MTPELIVLLTAALPVVELRGAIPLAMGAFGFSAGSAYMIAVIGNFLPVIPLFLFLRHVSEWLMRHVRFIDRFLTWLFSYTRRRHEEKFAGKNGFWKFVALAAFVAVPLPGTGAWTGALVAFLFGLPLWRSVGAIAAGIFGAGLFVLILTVGVGSIF